ncbi:TetR/AcrR family transcriptional regulator [Solicola sp. PLA-1-18]|uniref:TetR/AcrR family transcriptional regulator n=1 Tax=Solicola sp. PLA-1-18 TaxID=3380532 RepID=UPI003B76F1BB
MTSRMSTERVAELHAAVLAILAEDGYDRLTMDRVAADARTSKATLYRQWGDKETLVVDALGTLLPVEPEVPDTGSVRGDLEALMCDHADKPDIEMTIVGAIVHACRTNPDLAAGVRDNVVAAQRATFDTIVERGVQRGEIEPDRPAIEFVLPLLIGPALLREVIDGEPSDPVYMLRFVDAVLLPALGITS